MWCNFTLQRSRSRRFAKRQNNYLLNVMFPRMSVSDDFHTVIGTDNSVQNHNFQEHFHSNKSPTSCSPSYLCPFLLSNPFRQKTNCISVKREAIIWAYKTSLSLKSWQFISYLTTDSYLYINLYTSHDSTLIVHYMTRNEVSCHGRKEIRKSAKSKRKTQKEKETSKTK